MSEILLQRELAAGQEEMEGFRLSEQNVIDLLTKLQALKKLQNEILEQLQLHAGRVSLHDVSTSINVGMSYIEKYARDVTAQHPRNKVHWVGDELISDTYLDTIMTNVHEGLQDTGFVTLRDLAKQYGVPVDFIRRAVHARFDSVLDSVQLNGTVLFTPSYVKLQLDRLRDFVCALTRPMLLSEIAASFPALGDRLLADSVADLIASHAVEGHLRGREFVPSAFVESQRQTINAFFTANNYVPHAMVTQLQVAGRPHDFVKKQFPDCIDLDDVVVSAALLLHVEGAVEGLCHDPHSTWLDVRSELPSSAIDAKNAATLLTKALDRVKAQTKSSTAAAVVQVGGVFAVNATVLSQTMLKFQDIAKTRVSLAGTMAKPATSTGKAAKSKSKAASDGTGMCPTPDEQIELVMSWFDHCDGEYEFVRALLEALHSSIESCFATALAKAEATIHRGDSYIRRELTDTFEAGYDDRVGHLVVFQKAIHKLAIKVASAADAADGLAAIERSIVRSSGLDLCLWVLQYVNEHHQLELDGVTSIYDPQPLQPSMSGLSPRHEKIMTKRVTYAPTLVQAWHVAAEGASLADLMHRASQVAAAMGIPSRKFDRKKEKAVVVAFHQRLVQSLQGSVEDEAGERDFNDVLGVVCSLVFFGATSLALPLPLSAAEIQAVFPVLRHAFEASGVAADTVALLDDMHAAATELQLLQENRDLLHRALDTLVKKQETIY